MSRFARPLRILHARALVRTLAFLSSLLGITGLLASPAFAQAIHTYSNATDVAIPDNSCTAGVTRTFNVADSFDVVAVGVGLLIQHPSRGHIRATLQSPSGTVVTLFSNVGLDLDNFNVLLSPIAGTSVTTHTTQNDSLIAARYQREFNASGNLFSFADANTTPDSAGTWTLRLCDSVAGTSGNFLHADLYLVEPFADLSLSKTVSNPNPPANSTVTYTLTVRSDALSTSTATGVTVRDTLPAGFAFSSASGTGTFNSSTGVWSVGSLAPGASASLTISGIAFTSGTTETNIAEITASSLIDLDSTVNNGNAGEDDYAAVSYTTQTRTAGIPPALMCPAGSTVFDWTGKTWNTGAVPYSNNYTVAGVGTFSMTLSGNAAHAAGTPAVNTNLTGGFPADQSLFLNMNNASRSNSATVTIQFPTAIPGLQFRLYDVDYAAGTYADQVTVTGAFNGANVNPTLTNGTSNYVLGNVAIGDLGATDTTAAGNVVVSFSSPVDTITITYGNHTSAPVDPGNQHMAISNFTTICNPTTNLAVSKSSTLVSDIVSGTTNPKAIPGATLRYCVLITNPGSATATAVVASDTLPGGMQYIAGTLRSGNTCATASTVEDDNASGADESDPIGASVSGTTITATRASLGPSSSFAVTFDVTVI